MGDLCADTALQQYHNDETILRTYCQGTSPSQVVGCETPRATEIDCGVLECESSVETDVHVDYSTIGTLVWYCGSREENERCREQQQ